MGWVAPLTPPPVAEDVRVGWYLRTSLVCTAPTRPTTQSGSVTGLLPVVRGHL